MLTSFKQLLRDESGATAIEYGLIAALVSVAAIVALQNLGGSLETMFSTVSTSLDNAVTGGGGGGTPAPAPAP
jgi:pilus assembly protein Flp/PilA